MNIEQLNPGDVVYAACHIYNDGSLPGVQEDLLLAKPGARGVLVESGHLEENSERKVYLVRFEDDGFDLGPLMGCWEEELSTDRQVTA